MEFGRHSMESEKKENEGLGLHMINHGFEKDINETVTKIIDGSLRGGRKVEFEGTLVILGDVNAGAEVIAQDNIIVLGTIRGLAHAGATGNRKAIIAANEIDAPQIRIADIVKEIEYLDFDEEDEIEEEPKSKKKGKNKEREEVFDEFDDDYDIKTRAYIKDNEIVLE